METTMSRQWDHSCDVIVVGTGAGGMSTAVTAHDLGADVLMIEKTSLIGGTTATSGGGIWIPCNHHMGKHGFSDSPEEAMDYLKSTVGEEGSEEQFRAYIESGPQMVKYFEEKTRVQFFATGLPDYFPESPGGKTGYRTMEPETFNAAELSQSILKIRAPHMQTTIGPLMFNIPEINMLNSKTPGWIGLVLKRALNYLLDIPWRFKSARSRLLTCGNSLIARFVGTLEDRDIPVWVNSPLSELIEEEGRVVGVVAHRDGKAINIRANKAVVLAAGGFNGNQAMRDKYFTVPTKAEWSCAPSSNTGDAIQAGIDLGAKTALMDEAWWIPTWKLASKDVSCLMVMERALPGSMVVDQAGERYFNEAVAYDQAGRAMVEAHNKSGNSIPSYFIFDGRFRKKYSVGGVIFPSAQIPDGMMGEDRKQVLIKADTLDELAAKLDLPPASLQRTVDRYNQFSLTGKDEDFGRGDGSYDRHWADPKVEPNPCLAPIDTGPFYAIKMKTGDLGTKGGLLTDVNGNVLDENDKPISGLYAVGNNSASIMGRCYPSGGTTIGPALVYGFRAAQHITGKSISC